jgi:hypothetical protein
MDDGATSRPALNAGRFVPSVLVEDANFAALVAVLIVRCDAHRLHGEPPGPGGRRHGFAEAIIATVTCGQCDP